MLRRGTRFSVVSGRREAEGAPEARGSEHALDAVRAAPERIAAASPVPRLKDWLGAILAVLFLVAGVPLIATGAAVVAGIVLVALGIAIAGAGLVYRARGKWAC